MDLEEIQARFELAMAEFEQECKKQGLPQKIVTCNDQGVYIYFPRGELNYSIPGLAKGTIENYFIIQREAHDIFLRSLQDHKLELKKELKSFSKLSTAFFQRLARPSAQNLENMIQKTKLQIGFDKVLKEGALLGNYFFEEEAKNYLTPTLKPIQGELISFTQRIHELAKDIESIDIDRLHYFRNKYQLWYEGTELQG
ncbi:MAG TPA: hypothetical protein VJB13_00725 [Candidatus Nanoarchaeia archaeon]|nr:hypothetical protein [Candidatus Nanoarchaeia archaeon]